jgi:DNA-directed RNA polymerase specialized sigma24 family protein
MSASQSCPECGREVKVRSDTGRIAWHKRARTGSIRCPGGGRQVSQALPHDSTLAVFALVNRSRSERAAARDADVAAAALASPALTARQHAVIEARLDAPDLTYAELGAELGLTKNQVSGLMRRARIGATS